MILCCFFHNWSPEEKFPIQSAVLCNTIPCWRPLPASLYCKLQGLHWAGSLSWRGHVADSSVFTQLPPDLTVAMETLNGDGCGDLNGQETCRGCVQLQKLPKARKSDVQGRPTAASVSALLSNLPAGTKHRSDTAQPVPSLQRSNLFFTLCKVKVFLSLSSWNHSQFTEFSCIWATCVCYIADEFLGIYAMAKYSDE